METNLPPHLTPQEAIEARALLRDLRDAARELADGSPAWKAWLQGILDAMERRCAEDKEPTDDGA